MQSLGLLLKPSFRLSSIAICCLTMVHVLQGVSYPSVTKATACQSTSLINCLPSELLELIISFSVAEESFPQRRYYILSHVNWFWRKTIIGNPTFWTSVDLSWPIEVIQTILSRVGSLKLSFQFICHDPSLSPARTEAIRHILHLHSHCVETLHFDLESPVAQKTSGIPLPYLKRAIFHCGSHKGREIPFFADMSNLQCLDVSNCRADLPWEQLSRVLCRIRRLKIRFNSRPSYAKFLLNTSSFLDLEDLSVECLYGIDEDPEYQPRGSYLSRYPMHSFVLPNLQNLHILSFNMPTLMTRLHTPNLQEYEVCTRKYGSSHALRSHLHPIFEDFDYSAIQSLYVGFHPCCSAICVLGSRQGDFNVDQCLSNFSSIPFTHFESSCEVNAGPQGFHIRLFHSPTARVFLSKALNLLLPKLPNLLHLSLRLHEFRELDPNFGIFSPALIVLFAQATIKHLYVHADTRYALMVFGVLESANRCPKLETISCRFRNDSPLEVFRASTISLFQFLKTRLKNGGCSLKVLRLENCPVDGVLEHEADKLGILVMFTEPRPICQDLR